MNIHNDAIVHSCQLAMTVMPAPLAEEVLIPPAPTVMSSSTSSLLHPFRHRPTCTVPLQHFHSSGLVPINSLPCTIVDLQHTLILLGCAQFIPYRTSPSPFKNINIQGWPQLIPCYTFLHTLDVFRFHWRCASHVLLSNKCWIPKSQPLALFELGRFSSKASLALPS